MGIFTNFSRVKVDVEKGLEGLLFKRGGEYEENPPFSLPFFHEIKIRQNAYCILGKPENEVLRNFSSISLGKGKSKFKTSVMG